MFYNIRALGDCGFGKACLAYAISTNIHGIADLS